MPTAMANDGKLDLERSLEEIRREVIEARNLVIKSDNQLKNVHAELKTVQKRTEELGRRSWLSSIGAYLGFAGLAATGMVFFSNARVSAIAEERDAIARRLAEQTTQAEKQRSDGVLVSAAERSAAELYQQLAAQTPEERAAALERALKLDASRLSALSKVALSQRAQEVRRELVKTHLERGRGAAIRKDHAAALPELQKAYAWAQGTEDAPEVVGALGAAYVQLRRAEEAIALVTKTSFPEKRGKAWETAMLALMQAYEATRQPDKALEVAREGVAARATGEAGMAFRSRTGGGASAAPVAPAASGETPARQPLRPDAGTP